jgi:hypothetical protein
VKPGLSHKGKIIDLSVFEKRILRRIFVPKRNKVTGEWRNLQNEESYFVLIPKYYADQIKENEVGRT